MDSTNNVATHVENNGSFAVVTSNVLCQQWYDTYRETPTGLSVEERRASFDRFLATVGPRTDVFCLQEFATADFGACAGLHSFGCIAPLAATEVDTCALFYNPRRVQPAGPARVTPLTPLRPAGRVARCVVVQRFAVAAAGGACVDVASCHLHSEGTPEGLAHALNELAAAVASDESAAVPVVVCGDFNFDVWRYRRETERAFPAAVWSQALAGVTATHRTCHDTLNKLDHIFFTTGAVGTGVHALALVAREMHPPSGHMATALVPHAAAAVAPAAGRAFFSDHAAAWVQFRLVEGAHAAASTAAAKPTVPHGVAAPYAPSQRLFLALWPDAATRAAFVVWGEAWAGVSPMAVREPTETLHATLRFVGDATPAQRAALEAALPATFAPFLLRFRAGHVWGPKGVGVVGATAVPDALMALHLQADAAALAAGARSDRFVGANYSPHVTIFRSGAGGSVPPTTLPAVEWTVRSYSLVASTRGGYTVLRTWHASEAVTDQPPQQQDQTHGKNASE